MKNIWYETTECDYNEDVSYHGLSLWQNKNIFAFYEANMFPKWNTHVNLLSNTYLKTIILQITIQNNARAATTWC